MSKKKCEDCDGTGKVIDSNESSGERDCSRCAGTGEITVAYDALDEGPGQDGGGSTGGD